MLQVVDFSYRFDPEEDGACLFPNSSAPWETSARRLWSLWDMIRYSCANLCHMYDQITVAIQGLASAQPDEVLSTSFKAAIAESALPPASEQVISLRLDMKLHFRIHRLGEQLRGDEHFTAGALLRDLQLLRDDLVLELSDRTFAYIAPPNNAYFANEQLFGNEVYLAFSDARGDIRDAGDCLAASLPTACVYHLMRATEHGLRRLAKKLHVTLTHTGKRQPLEYGEWDKVITAIRNKIATIRKLPSGPKRQAQLERYSNAADHCEYMKDIWRNNLAHTRRPYTDKEAIAALERVRDFMQFLGQHLAK